MYQALPKTIKFEVSMKTASGSALKLLLKSSNAYNTQLDVISAIYNTWDINHLKRVGVINAYLLNWKPQYFSAQLNENNDNTITHKGINYQVKYIAHYQKVDFMIASKIALSFRYCEELNMAVVLIKYIF